MSYVAPDPVPEWFDQSKLADGRKKIYPLDSFGTQWAECVVSPSDDEVYRCDLKSVDKEGNEHTYGRYYVSGNRWRVVLPPGLFAYSGYEYGDVVALVKGGKLVKLDNGAVSADDIVSADAVVLGRD